MKRFASLFLLMYSVFAAAQEKEIFDHKNIIVIAAIKEDKNCIFAGTEFFLHMRKIIENSMTQFSPIADMPTAYLYELFMMDKDGITKTVFLGDHWLSDGNLFSQLSEEDFSLLSRAIKSRRFENDNSLLKSFTLDINIESYNYLLLKPLDYQQIGRQPTDNHVNPPVEKPAPDSNFKPITQEVEKPNSSKSSQATNSSTSSKPLVENIKIRQADTTELNIGRTESTKDSQAEESKLSTSSSNEKGIPKIAFLLCLIVIGLIWRWVK